jgi:hypothetical protein
MFNRDGWLEFFSEGLNRLVKRKRRLSQAPPFGSLRGFVINAQFSALRGKF